MRSHGKKIAINSIAGIVYKVIILLLGFLSRKLFIMFMGKELLGLNSLFTDLLNFLNLADLGIGVSVQFSLYKPIAEKDEQKIVSIVNITKKIFDLIGITITIVGFLLTFFLNYFIAENPYSDNFLRIAFFLNVLSISLTYFVAHKKIFLQANEEIYFINIIDILSQIVGIILKVIAIIVFKNYFLYVGISIIGVLFSNMCIEYICNKKYAFLNEPTSVNQEDKRILFKDLKDVIPLKIGTYLYTSTDNVIISTFLGLKDVAIYSNYMLITNSIMQFFYIIAESFKVSFGTAFNEGRNEKNMLQYFDAYFFLQFLLSSFSAVSLWCLMTPFVEMFFGNEYKMAATVVLVVVMDMFIHSMYQPLSMMFGALGKFREDKIITLGIDVVNIVLSIILVQKIGLLGPILGTFVSNILTFLFRCYQIIYKEFSINVWRFLKRFLCFVIFTIIEMVLVSYICDTFFEVNTILTFFARIMTCVVVPNVINVICWHRTKEFHLIWNRVKTIAFR